MKLTEIQKEIVVNHHIKESKEAIKTSNNMPDNKYYDNIKKYANKLSSLIHKNISYDDADFLELLRINQYLFATFYRVEHKL